MSGQRGEMAMALKSVRIPDDVIAYIEQQPGKDFSKKLVGTLCAYRDIIARKEQIKNYDKAVDEIERLVIKLRIANNKLADINSVLKDKPAHQLSFNTDLGEIVVNK